MLLLQLEDYVLLLTEAAFVKKRPSSPHTSLSFVVSVLPVPRAAAVEKLVAVSSG